MDLKTRPETVYIQLNPMRGPYDIMQFIFYLLITAQSFAQSVPTSKPDLRGVLPARWHNSGFTAGDDHYNALTAASDGKIYYVICAKGIDTGAQMFAYDPATGASKHLGDLTEAAGEKGRKAVPQGKSHVKFLEHKGKLYFATHLGYYRREGGKEMVGDPPAGYQPYPGGHFLSYDMASGKFEDLALAPEREGILTMAMDQRRGKLYGLTWPSGLFLSYDLATRQLQNHGATACAACRSGSERYCP